MDSQDQDRQMRVDRAKELLQTVRHASMATVNADGSPHNSPLFFMYDADLTHVYWGSQPTAEHSKNIARTGQAYVALYDGNAKGGLYFKLANGRIAKGAELQQAVAAHNQARARFNVGPPLDDHYVAAGPPMYVADIQGMWVNGAQRDARGMVVRDFKYSVTASDLLQSK